MTKKKFACKDWYPDEVIICIGRECDNDCRNCDVFKTLQKKHSDWWIK